MIRKITIGKKSLRIKDCRGLSSLRGLMFDKLDGKDGALIRGNSVWTPFCVPLDLYFLDPDFLVLEKKAAMPLTLNPKTWKTYSNRKAKYCLELRQGIVGIRKGQKIKFL